MRITLFSLGLTSIIVGCAVGATGGDVPPRKDGGIIAKGGDGGSSSPTDDGGTNNPPTNNCVGTLCGSQCVDTTSDPSNCGGCGVACASTETCSSGQCTSGAPNNPPTSNEPPQGSCSHSLCTSGSALTEGCDTAGCSTVICDPQYLADSYCCTTSWDSQCMQEVTAYCSPYSCQ